MNFESHGNGEFERMIRPIMITVKMMSVWPLPENSGQATRFFRKFHRYWAFFVLVVVSFAGTLDVFRSIEDIDKATEGALSTSALFFCVFRLTIYSCHEKDLFYVVNTMREDWNSPYEDRVVLTRKMMFAFRLAKCFIGGVAMTILLFMCVPILETYAMGADEKILPFRGYFFVNHTVSPIYEVLYLLNIMAGGFGGSMIAGATSFNLILIVHGSAKFAVLQRRLEALRHDDPDSNSVIEDCVVRHQEAIAYADALERIINVMALGQFVISTGLLCFAGFQITSMMEEKGQLMKYFAFLNSAILELFIYSFSGHDLIDESAAVGYSAYNSDWIGGSFSQNLRIIMMRSTVPSQITAAKFYSLSLESFSAVLSTSFSYFTVLTATKDD